MRRCRKSQNVHTVACLHREPGVTVCCCWLDLEPELRVMTPIIRGESEVFIAGSIDLGGVSSRRIAGRRVASRA